MQGNVNPKIIGAVVVGFALVGAAFTVSSINSDRTIVQPAAVKASEPLPRVAIAVDDKDQNGIEDWRDEFITTEPIILNQATTAYTPPDTLTGQLGINFMENIIRARGYGAFGQSDEEVITGTVDILSQSTAHTLYDTPDIIIIKNWTEQDVVNYANTVAGAINRNDLPDSQSELLILQDILTSGNNGRVTELNSLSEAYKRNRDDTLGTPVPAFMVKEHLDLINTFHAIHKDIEAMSAAIDDPAFALLRLKRYEDDASGLGYAMQNMFFALDDYAHLFKVTDPATLFVIFSPDFQI